MDWPVEDEPVLVAELGHQHWSSFLEVLKAAVVQEELLVSTLVLLVGLSTKSPTLTGSPVVVLVALPSFGILDTYKHPVA